jgi:hypothetical protein
MDEEILDVLIRTNAEMKKPVDEKLLRGILGIVAKNPLTDDRGRSQDQIEFIINQCQGEEGK